MAGGSGGEVEDEALADASIESRSCANCPDFLRCEGHVVSSGIGGHGTARPLVALGPSERLYSSVLDL